MLYELVELYRRGVKRPRAEVVGCERLVVHLRYSVLSGTPLLDAIVPTGYGACRAGAVCPLLRPQIVKWDDRGMVIKGTQRDVRNGTLFEYVQAWALKPAPADAKPSNPWEHPECRNQIAARQPEG